MPDPNQDSFLYVNKDGKVLRDHEGLTAKVEKDAEDLISEITGHNASGNASTLDIVQKLVDAFRNGPLSSKRKGHIHNVNKRPINQPSVKDKTKIEMEAYSRASSRVSHRNESANGSFDDDLTKHTYREDQVNPLRKKDSYDLFHNSELQEMEAGTARELDGNRRHSSTTRESDTTDAESGGARFKMINGKFCMVAQKDADGNLFIPGAEAVLGRGHTEIGKGMDVEDMLRIKGRMEATAKADFRGVSMRALRTDIRSTDHELKAEASVDARVADVNVLNADVTGLRTGGRIEATAKVTGAELNVGNFTATGVDERTNCIASLRTGVSANFGNVEIAGLGEKGATVEADLTAGISAGNVFIGVNRRSRALLSTRFSIGNINLTVGPPSISLNPGLDLGIPFMGGGGGENGGGGDNGGSDAGGASGGGKGTIGSGDDNSGRSGGGSSNGETNNGGGNNGGSGNDSHSRGSNTATSIGSADHTGVGAVGARCSEYEGLDYKGEGASNGCGDGGTHGVQNGGENRNDPYSENRGGYIFIPGSSSFDGYAFANPKSTNFNDGSKNSMKRNGMPSKYETSTVSPSTADRAMTNNSRNTERRTIKERHLQGYVVEKNTFGVNEDFDLSENEVLIVVDNADDEAVSELTACLGAQPTTQHMSFSENNTVRSSSQRSTRGFQNGIEQEKTRRNKSLTSSGIQNTNVSGYGHGAGGAKYGRRSQLSDYTGKYNTIGGNSVTRSQIQTDSGLIGINEPKQRRPRDVYVSKGSLVNSSNSRNVTGKAGKGNQSSRESDRSMRESQTVQDSQEGSKREPKFGRRSKNVIKKPRSNEPSLIQKGQQNSTDTTANTTHALNRTNLKSASWYNKRLRNLVEERLGSESHVFRGGDSSARPSSSYWRDSDKVKRDVLKDYGRVNSQSGGNSTTGNGSHSSDLALTGCRSTGEGEDRKIAPKVKAQKKKPFGEKKNIHTIFTLGGGEGKPVKYLKDNLACFMDE